MTDEVEVISTDRALGRLEGKVDLLLTNHDALAARLDTILGDHAGRITACERKVWYGSGIAAALTLLVGKITFLPH